MKLIRLRDFEVLPADLKHHMRAVCIATVAAGARTPGSLANRRLAMTRSGTVAVAGTCVRALAQPPAGTASPAPYFVAKRTVLSGPVFHGCKTERKKHPNIFNTPQRNVIGLSALFRCNCYSFSPFNPPGLKEAPYESGRRPAC